MIMMMMGVFGGFGFFTLLDVFTDWGTTPGCFASSVMADASGGLTRLLAARGEVSQIWKLINSGKLPG
jgi:hypothetical protein